MLISALTPLTLLDFPEKTACIVFTTGCNFRCGYCHNAEFVLPEKIKQYKNFVEENNFFAFLDKRKNLLDGVVICGGEPTIHADLPEFCAKIKAKNFLVKLDTNGSNPKMLQNLLDKKLVDFVAMDIKAPLDEYEMMSGVVISSSFIQESINIIIEKAPDYEFRTTCISWFHTSERLEKIKKSLVGAKKHVLQDCRPQNTLLPDFCK